MTSQEIGPSLEKNNGDLLGLELANEEQKKKTESNEGLFSKLEMKKTSPGSQSDPLGNLLDAEPSSSFKFLNAGPNTVHVPKEEEHPASLLDNVLDDLSAPKNDDLLGNIGKSNISFPVQGAQNFKFSQSHVKEPDNLISFDLKREKETETKKRNSEKCFSFIDDELNLPAKK